MRLPSELMTTHQGRGPPPPAPPPAPPPTEPLVEAGENPCS